MKTLATALVLVSSLTPAFATVEAFREPVHVSRTFSVKVEDRGKPVAGLPVLLAICWGNPQKEVTHTTTDGLGIAKFEHIRRGHYCLQWGEQWSMEKTGGEEIRVGRGLKQIVREWPCCVVDIQQVIGKVTSLRWLVVDQSERMKVLASDPNGVMTLAGVKLDLHELRTYRLIAEQETDQQGGFHFDDIAAGMYVLRCSGGLLSKVPKAEGFIRLDVDPQASPGVLNISLGAVERSFAGEKVVIASK